MSIDIVPAQSYHQSPRRLHLYKIWQALWSEPSLPQVDRWLAQYFREHKSFGKKDRQWYADAVFTGLRLAPLVVFLAETPGEVIASDDLDCERRIMIWQERYKEIASFHTALQRLPPPEFFELLSLCRQVSETTPTPKTASVHALLLQLRNHSRSNPDAAALLAGFLPFYKDSWQRRIALSAFSGASQELFISGQRQKPPLWLRLNRPDLLVAALREFRERNIEVFEREGAFFLDAGVALQSFSSLQNGVFVIQDLASQMIGAAMDLSDVKLVWDCCAGGGGKTLQLASRLHGRGRVLASDTRAYKLHDLQKRAAAAGAENIATAAWDGHRPPRWPGEAGGSLVFDAVLIDAPCSGSGTWRRSPDHKFRFSAQRLSELQSIQCGLIKTVSLELKALGEIVYATCSWLPEENEDVVRIALEQNPKLELIEQRLIGFPEVDADTMFYARLRKRP